MTFLFTDIEGSTRRWESDADAMRVALACHDKVLRSAIEAHDGFVFSHSGDGLAAAFASPSAAVEAAVDAQRQLELPVRMGIATGEAEVRDGDYFGTVLNRAARVMAAGHGGQILVAESTAVLLDGVELLNLGPRRLRDLPNPVTLSQIAAPGLRTEFPQLRTLDSNLGNLRPAASMLIGRDADVEEVVSATRSHRLITLAGVGGVGKTRLALEVASVLADEFPDGVWLFEFASVTDPAAVPDAVAAVLGITQQPGLTMGETIAAALEGRVRLLVFDNCEHVVDSAADLIDLILARSATVKIVSTSREGLGLTDERLWRVPSLEVGAAVRLFKDRAARDLSAEESAAVEEICRRLDGIPLAIELAASRMESMTATEMRDRLDHRFKLLVRSRRGLERHQTLRQAVSWSYDLLAETERSLLERCSVFAGGFDVQSASAVSGFDDADEFMILDLLDSLVRKSLLVADRATGKTRFSMLETIRQFAEEKLVERGEAAEASSAHARYFADRETDILTLWDSAGQREAYEWFAIELANLRTAFRWAADRGDLDSAASIATCGWLLGFFGAENHEPVSWAEELIEPAGAIGHPRLVDLYVAASLCWMTGRVEQALQYTERGQTILASSSHLPSYGLEGGLGGPYMAIGQAERWAELCRTQLEHRGDNHVAIRICLVFALAWAGLVDEARAAADGLIESAVASGNPYLHTMAIGAYGSCLGSVGSERDLELCRQGLALAQETGNRYTETVLAFMLARLEGEPVVTLSALDHLTLVIRHYHDSGNVGSLVGPLAILSAFLDRLGRFEAAATLAGFSYDFVSLASVPELATTIAHLREVLGDQLYESLAQHGEAMSTAAIVAYAYDQIDQARTQLERSP
ncbi:adenylate/guanylate cyclase domain-containing protein [Mycobacterium sp. 1164985.4]|uniref:ATP-binding protein n=1 Tax=Mycobacterium sp. 1164985.4 TaxID=1834069 RepID=UPI000801CE73|nr:adenylate/guanylate cyclase domain-containing protein [Mycobacterium sp. 1164985.4]OBK75250.1 cyclase [Mycobacterium sp. 1164985.4]